MTNSRTLVFGGYGRQVAIDDLGPGDYNSKPWMVPNGDMGDGEVTRDGTQARGHLRLRREQEARRSSPSTATSRPSSRPPTRTFACAMTQRRRAATATRRGRRTAPGSPSRAAPGSRSRASPSSAPDDCAAPNDVVADARPAPSPTGAPPTPPAAAYKPPVTTPRSRRPRPHAGAEPSRPRSSRSSRRAGLAQGLAVTVTVPAAGKVKVAATSQGQEGRERRAPPRSRPARSRSALVKKSLKGKTLTLKLTFKGPTIDEDAEVGG